MYFDLEAHNYCTCLSYPYCTGDSCYSDSCFVLKVNFYPLPSGNAEAEAVAISNTTMNKPTVKVISWQNTAHQSTSKHLTHSSSHTSFYIGKELGEKLKLNEPGRHELESQHS